MLVVRFGTLTIVHPVCFLHTTTIVAAVDDARDETLENCSTDRKAVFQKVPPTRNTNSV